MNPRPSPLRDRQRRKTAGEIQHATLNLVRQYGLEHVTTEMIAEEAGVSPRTFFNYFPNQAAAMVGPPINLHEAALAEFSAARGPLTRDFGRLLLMQFRDNADRKATIRAVDEVIGLHPELEPEFLRSLSAVTTQLARALDERLAGRDCPTALLVEVLTRAMAHAFREWANDDAMTPEAAAARTVGRLDMVGRALAAQ